MSKFKKVEPASFANDELPRVEFIPEAGSDFVVTSYIQDLTERALAYLTVGYAVHLCGPAGTGKSTLAMHIASQLGRACTLLHGDDEFKASDLLGRDSGYHRSSTVDNYVSSIVKTEETLSPLWSNNRLTTACQKGHTLIYDEFTRSPATANNPFLSILEEGILNIPSSGKQKGYIKVHENFRAIFTSNPEEYVGVHKTQDALLDRMITMRLDYQDRDTETAIVRAKSQRNAADAASIVNIVRTLRTMLGGNAGPTVRAAIAIARILDFRKSPVDPTDPIFLSTCRDVLCYHTWRQPSQSVSQDQITAVILSLGAAADPPSQLPTATVAESEPIAAAMPPDLNGPEIEIVPATDALQSTPQSVVSVEEEMLTSAQALATELNQALAISPPPALSTAATDQTSRPIPAFESQEPAMAPATTLNETASPRQMLEAAVSRFLRPPNFSSSEGPVASPRLHTPPLDYYRDLTN